MEYSFPTASGHGTYLKYVVDMLSETPLEKINFPFPSRYPW